ncbi:FxSxx-COOH system tetratricopeptide repeat protein [Amycolatopsis sp. OK19-0408]|uniref:FxSxx-COOH system tetratricopeptide repeat protein n=1 Tax=Amycolatopsis iheyensis TaxID=2945988 RepID=A0A9X2NC29_9PSEU|nr:FxSxx-COOH system tetratricopeptide repeat protein [Amycolatopsis iheyensis]MCR6481755.1 FxSxx-COOH system tetratricopeptide repeat protein [Amycolatopsis iheyensis]
MTTPADEPPAPGTPEPSLRSRDLTFRELRDVLWLATRLGTPRSAREPAKPAKPPKPAKKKPVLDDADQPPPGSDRPATDEPAGAVRPEPGDLAEADVPPLGWQDWLPGPTRFVRAAGVTADDGREAAPLNWPTAPALPHAREISRALRPLMRASPSPWATVLDEERTAVQAADDGLWLPVWKPDRWHRFELSLVVDTAPSMEIWQHTVGEFRNLARRQGAFRDVRVHLLDSSAPSTGDPVLRAEGPGGAAYRARDLADPTGRRMVIVLTDAIGANWHDGVAHEMLARWSEQMPVAVAHMLPQRLWTWGGLSPSRLRLSATAPGVPNRRLRVRPREAGGDVAPAVAEGAVPVPVLTLSESWLGDWAKLVSTATTIETTAVLAHRDHRKRLAAGGPAEPPEELTPRSQVLRFRTYASAQAFQLAGLLAAAPLNLPIMRLVQRVLLPGSGLPALAEVLLGGLLQRVSRNADSADPSEVTFEFRDGIRAELLSGERRDTTVRVARVLGNYAGARIAALRNYRDAVDDPDATSRLEASPENLPYLRVQEAVFRALSGRYARRAKKLEADLAPSGPGSTVVRNTVSGSIQNGRHDREDQNLTTTDTRTSPGEPAGTTAPSGGDDAVTTPASPISAAGPQPRVRPQIWGTIPLRNPDFVGRVDLLEQLRDRLVQAGGATAVLPEALHGMGGVGKSQTVVEYIYRHATEYDVIWWIPAEHTSQISSSLVELAKRLGLQVPGTADAAVPSVLEALRKGEPYGRWLLVFDNADRPDVVSPFFPAISGHTGHIVVTSRNSQWSGVARTVEVDLFTREESKELLRRAGGEITEEDANELAEALGDLPLAIEQAAAWRAQTGMPVVEYLQLLDQNLAELTEFEVSSDYQRSVAAAWNVPLAKLRASHPAALQLLQVCAFFGPEPISRSLFTAVRNAPVPEDLGNALSQPIRLNLAIREISRYSLARLDHRSNTLQLHRLVQTVLKNQLNEAEQDELRHAVHILLVHGDPNDPENSANWKTYSELLPHAMVSRMMECQSDAWVRRMMVNLVRYLVSYGDYEQARETSKQALTKWQAMFGESDPDTLSMARLQGVSLWRLGRMEEARELNSRTYQLVKETLGEENELFLSVANTVRQDMRSLGRFDRELEMGEDILERSRRVLGEDDPATLAAGNNLASTLRLVGRFFQAKDIDEDVWRRKKIVLGEEHIDTFMTLNALAMDLRECGQYVEACQLQEETLIRQREVVGADHPRTIGAMRNLAVARRKAGDHDGAFVLSKECVERYRRRHGDEHLDTITSETCMAADLRHLGDLTEARKLGESSHRLFVETHGEEHPFTLVAAINLGITLRLMGHVEQARDLDDRSAAALRKVFGDDHPSTMVCVTNLASDFAALGDTTRAHELDVANLERSGRVLGKDHPATLAIAVNLSIDLRAMGRDDEAAILHTNTLAGLRKALGDRHQAVAAAVKSERANCDTDTMQL